MSTVDKAKCGPRRDLTGLKFNKLLVVGYTYHNDKIYWKCLCDCGMPTEVYGSKLKAGTTKSCGCWHRERARKSLTTHGMKHTRTYRIWWRMVTRVTNPNDADYHRYGKLGMADSWRKFENFYADMGEVSEGLSLERVDNDRGYFPDNCKWATTLEQSRNTLRTVRITRSGITKSLHEWCDILNKDYSLAYSRHVRGWVGETIFEPKGYRRAR